MPKISAAAKLAGEVIQQWRDCPYEYKKAGCRNDCPAYNFNCDDIGNHVIENIIQMAIDFSVNDLSQQLTSTSNEMIRLREGIKGLEAVLGAGGNIEWPNSKHVLAHRISEFGIVNCFNKLLVTGKSLMDAIYNLAGETKDIT